MDNEKNTNFQDRSKDDFPNEPAPRARNRTVMLTPDVTGEVRARLAQDMGQAPMTPPQRTQTPFETPMPPNSYSSGGGSRTQSAPPAAGAGRAPQVTPDSRTEGAFWAQESVLVGFLVSYDTNPNGTIFELRSGRVIVTSEPAGNGNYLLINDNTVSPMHAIMRITTGGEVQVLDQLSEFGTRVQRFGSEEEEELSGDKSSLEHGDVLKFGNRKFHVCIIARGDQS